MKDRYRLYVRYMNGASDALLPLLPNRSCQAHFLEIHRVMSPEEFATCWASSAHDPERRQRLEQLLQEGYAFSLTSEEIALWQGRLGLPRCA